MNQSDKRSDYPEPTNLHSAQMQHPNKKSGPQSTDMSQLHIEIQKWLQQYSQSALGLPQYSWIESYLVDKFRLSIELQPNSHYHLHSDLQEHPDMNIVHSNLRHMQWFELDYWGIHPQVLLHHLHLRHRACLYHTR